MVSIHRVKQTDEAFRSLILQLDEELAAQYGELQIQYGAHNQTDGLLLAVVAFADGDPAACGAIRDHGDGEVEIKRMYVSPEFRRQGLARRVLGELERAAHELGYVRAVLETGVKQSAAIALYQGLGYQFIENYGPYVGNANSVCMGKML